MEKQICTSSYSHKGFTLAEVLITLVIIGIIAAITVPALIAKYNEQQTVARVKKAYSIVSQAWNKYQVDYNCMGKVANCFESTDSFGNNDKFVQRFMKYFINVQHISVRKSLSDVTWLPEKVYALDGSLVNNDWYGVKKYTSTGDTFYFTLNDGMIFHIEIPDNRMQSGFIFFDINGKKGPNRIGKDQFPIGIGAYNNKKYEAIVHPFFNEDNTSFNGGLCNIRDNQECNPDVCTQTNCSPTAYVLKYNKLPPINW